MSSRAKGFRSRKRRRSYGQSNKERRFKSIEVHRPVKTESSDALFAALSILFDSEIEEGEWPKVEKIPTKHRVPILNPSVVRQKFSRGFESGYNFHSAMNDIEASFGGVEEPTISIVGISVVGFSSKRAFIVANTADERHFYEKKAVRRSLAEAGVRGFYGKGSRDRTLSRVVIAQMVDHIPTDKEIAKGNLVLPGSDQPPMSSHTLAGHVEEILITHGISDLQLGKAVVKAV